MEVNKSKAYFWRRLGAAWVDLFIVYSITVFLLAVSEALRVSVSFEPIYFSFAALYGTVAVALKGQTVGKLLLGIKVTSQANGQLGLKTAIVREAIGKWGLVVAVPVILGRLIVGRAWVATAYDLLVVAFALILLVLYLLFTKQTWYDQLAGSTLIRKAGPANLSKASILILIGATFLCAGTKTAEYKAKCYLPCRLAIYQSMSSIEPYKDFLNQRHAMPVDYVIGLFDRHDVVVLCERVHPEASQWDFIYELVSDPRFIARVGNIFTEYGQVGMQDYLDTFMATDSLDAAGIDERIIHIMRNFPVWPAWTNTNFYTYLKRLYKLNQTLPPGMRIRHYLTDSLIDWSKIETEEEYQAYFRSIRDRDKQMAMSVIQEINRLAELETDPPKGLVIMNYRHAFDLTGGSSETKRHNTYEYLKYDLGSRTANVLLNTDILVFAPIAGGLWDEAFAETGNQSAGFDLENSPFGKDPFDLFPFVPGIKGHLNYSDVFTGFAFVQPLEKQYLLEGIPGYFSGFEKEALRRAALVNEDYLYAIEFSIAQDKKGNLPYRRELPSKEIETLVEIFILAFNAVGLIIALTALINIRLSTGSTGKSQVE